MQKCLLIGTVSQVSHVASRPELDLKFGMHVVKTLFYFVKPADYTYYTYVSIFQAFEASGYVLSRSELDPFFIYGMIQFEPKAGLAPVIQTMILYTFKTFKIYLQGCSTL